MHKLNRKIMVTIFLISQKTTVTGSLPFAFYRSSGSEEIEAQPLLLT